ncbi:diguanylate cyclase [Ahrensia kielensis]|uniref:diguanylate cyclase n=1 Tax=Ahrensia kielensis TaxID=76980 RepID=A0ABU9T6B8_9HYPH
MLKTALVVAFIEAAGIMALTAVAFGIIIRAKFTPLQESLTIGLLFSFAAIFSMITPVEFAPGIIIDGRAIMVGLGAAFGGLPAAIVVSITASAARFYIGGEGALSGVVGIILAAILGYAWIKICKCKGRPNFHHLVIGGTMISLQLVGFYILPWELANKIIWNVYPFLLPTSIISTVILGTLIEREHALFEATIKLETAANTDVLTGLMNRRGLEIAIESMAPQTNTTDSVVVFDLDHFKAVNDKYGHNGGDKALISFAHILELNARETDVAVRIGGEEFALFLRDTTAEQAETITQRILQNVRSTPIHFNGRSFPITVSAGISEYFAQKTKYSQAMHEADKALYQAKNNGRDQMVQASNLAAA